MGIRLGGRLATIVIVAVRSWRPSQVLVRRRRYLSSLRRSSKSAGLRLKPGESEGMHTHPDYVLYALTDYRVKNTSADGTVRVFDRKRGDVFWGKPVTHGGENVGDTEVHALIVELKQAKSEQGTPIQ